MRKPRIVPVSLTMSSSSGRTASTVRWLSGAGISQMPNLVMMPEFDRVKMSSSVGPKP